MSTCSCCPCPDYDDVYGHLRVRQTIHAGQGRQGQQGPGGQAMGRGNCPSRSTMQPRLTIDWDRLYHLGSRPHAAHGSTERRGQQFPPLAPLLLGVLWNVHFWDASTPCLQSLHQRLIVWVAASCRPPAQCESWGCGGMSGTVCLKHVLGLRGVQTSRSSSTRLMTQR